ncbi:hypothetical protein AX16_005341 [Volvariella volvacea WC 439]|nr:hypothetical protein AX16_005341 [Volvariella volvacea WC 439]
MSCYQKAPTANGHLGIPTEILSVIFESSLSQPIHIPPDFTQPPWLLTRICSHWRRVALNTPSLWCEIDFDLRGQIDPTPRLRLGVLCAQRAGSMPLSVQNAVNLMEGIINTTTPQFVDEFLVPHSRRLSVLQLTVSARAMEGLFKLPAGSLANLKEISINCTDMERSQGVLWTQEATAFRECPHLQSVHIKSLFERVDPRVLNLPWGQLTILAFANAYMSLESCHAILQHCARLEFAALGFDAMSGSSNNDAFALTAEKVVLPHLSHLSVQFNYGYTPIFSILTLPSIKTIKLQSGMDVTAGWSPEAFQQFIRRSSCQILQLSLDFTNFDGQHLLSMLQCSPTLQYCVIKCRSDLAEVFEKVGTGELVPQLIALVLRVETSETAGQLFDALERRVRLGRNDVTKVETVKMILTNVLPKEFYRRAQILKERGVTIS